MQILDVVSVIVAITAVIIVFLAYRRLISAQQAVVQERRKVSNFIKKFLKSSEIYWKEFE